MAAERDADRLAIVVDDLHEIFRIYAEQPPGLKERLFQFRRAQYEEFHALKGVSFTVRHGESIGLIGHNGSGKSTLLKCLARILPADRGEVTVNGRIATLLELGAGFHPDLSGRENIYLNGAILGLSRDEIDESFDAIVEFAGVDDFVDTPVRNYSSGMYVRLGFAIAVHVDPEILLVDEVLSVGDASFQEKSLARMRNFSQRGKTVVLVSHDLSAIGALCERTLVLDHGRVVFDGPTDEAIDVYEEIVASGEPAEIAEDPEDLGRNGDFRAKTTRVTINDVRADHPETDTPITVASGDPMRITVELEAHDDLVSDGGLTCGINVRRDDITPYLYETRTSWRGAYLAPPPKGHHARVTFDMACNLLAGDYLVDVFLGNAERPGVVHDRWQQAATVQVTAPDHDYGVAAMRADVTIDNPDGIWPPESVPPPVEEGGPAHRGSEGRR